MSTTTATPGFRRMVEFVGDECIIQAIAAYRGRMIVVRRADIVSGRMGVFQSPRTLAGATEYIVIMCKSVSVATVSRELRHVLKGSK